MDTLLRIFRDVRVHQPLVKSLYFISIRKGRSEFPRQTNLRKHASAVELRPDVFRFTFFERDPRPTDGIRPLLPIGVTQRRTVLNGNLRVGDLRPRLAVVADRYLTGIRRAERGIRRILHIVRPPDSNASLDVRDRIAAEAQARNLRFLRQGQHHVPVDRRHRIRPAVREQGICGAVHGNGYAVQIGGGCRARIKRLIDDDCFVRQKLLRHVIDRRQQGFVRVHADVISDRGSRLRVVQFVVLESGQIQKGAVASVINRFISDQSVMYMSGKINHLRIIGKKLLDSFARLSDRPCVGAIDRIAQRLMSDDENRLVFVRALRQGAFQPRQLRLRNIGVPVAVHPRLRIEHDKMIAVYPRIEINLFHGIARILSDKALIPFLFYGEIRVRTAREFLSALVPFVFVIPESDNIYGSGAISFQIAEKALIFFLPPGIGNVTRDDERVAVRKLFRIDRQRISEFFGKFRELIIRPPRLIMNVADNLEIQQYLRFLLRDRFLRNRRRQCRRSENKGSREDESQKNIFQSHFSFPSPFDPSVFSVFLFLCRHQSRNEQEGRKKWRRKETLAARIAFGSFGKFLE